MVANYADTFIVGVHGNAGNVSDRSSGRDIPLNAKDLAKLIKEDKNYSTGMTIVLISCNTGAIPPKVADRFAQQLADEMGEGSEVIAPDGFFGVSIDGNTHVYLPDSNDPSKPDLNTKGSMKKFVGGLVEIVDRVEPPDENF
jgi:hypothetical protein